MKSKALALMILLIVASGGFGYYIGAFARVGAPSGSTSISSTSNSIDYPLSILPANWTNQYTAASGYCGVVAMRGSIPGSGAISPDAICNVVVGGNQAGTITLVVRNSGDKTSIVFEALSLDPSKVYFTNPQGCPSPGGIGFCGYVDANSTKSFVFDWVSNPGSFGPMNVTLSVLVAAVPFG